MSIGVTDHALIRYLERHVGLDFDAYREEILPLQLKIAIATCGDGRYPIPGTKLIAVVRNESIVTVLGEFEESDLSNGS